jgi:hypothetical protein
MNLIRLQQLLSAKKEKINEEKELQPEIKLLQKKNYENNIDPLKYLLYGNLIIFPKEKLSKLSVQDMTEYFRCYPYFHWTKVNNYFLNK